MTEVFTSIRVFNLFLQENKDELESSVREGAGKVLFPSSSQYEGEFHKGLRHGRGVFQFKSGARFEGEWKKGLKHGLGKFSYPDGSWYYGDWKHGKKNGFGQYVFGNGDIYDGAWKDDVKHGMGTYNYYEAEIVIKATWIEGQPRGPIEIFYSNFIYHGYWKDESPVGEGAFSFRMKHLLQGHVERVFKPAGDESKSLETLKLFNMKSSKGKTNLKDENEERSAIGSCVTRFIAHSIEPYEYKRLAQQPIPLPKEDSVVTLCSQSSKSGASEVALDCNENEEAATVNTSENQE